MSSSGTPSHRRLRAAQREEEENVINSTYRSTYGGRAGLSANSWTSRSSASMSSTSQTPLSRQQSLNSTGRQPSSVLSPSASSLGMEKLTINGSDEVTSSANNAALARAEAALAAAKQQLAASAKINLNTIKTPPSAAALGAAHRASALVSQLTTGSRSQQQEAAETLLEALKSHGEPVQIAAHQAGGTHMLHTLLRSGGTELRQTCAAALAEVCKHPPALEELAAAPEAPPVIVSACLQGISKGDESYTNLFTELMKSDNDSVKAAVASHKAVRILADVIADEGDKNNEQTKSEALRALESLCLADPAANMKKLAWSGGLAALVPQLFPIESPNAGTSLNLLLVAIEQDSRFAESICSPGLIEALSLYIADADVPLEMQVGVAKLLAGIAALRTRKEDATRALNDFSLPRACEVLHQAENVWKNGAPKDLKEKDLHAACALLIGHLSLGSPLCCHVVLFHAEALKTVVSVLTGCHEFALVEAVLGSTADYAAQPKSLLSLAS